MNWEDIKKEYETTNITLKALAEKHDIKIGTLKSRKSREGWIRGPAKKDATKAKKVATPKKDASSKKQRARSGNPNPKNQFTKRNTAAVTHGLFSKYLPKETLEIVYDIEQSSPIEIIWMNIQLQFAQIVRAQQIMFVESKEDMTKELKKRKESDHSEEAEWEIQFAWDKQANFLNSQSRAMSTLQKLIEQYEHMATDEQMLRIEKLKADIARIKGDPEEEFEDDGFMEALDGKVEEVWSDDEET